MWWYDMAVRYWSEYAIALDFFIQPVLRAPDVLAPGVGAHAAHWIVQMTLTVVFMFALARTLMRILASWWHLGVTALFAAVTALSLYCLVRLNYPPAEWIAAAAQPPPTATEPPTLYEWLSMARGVLSTGLSQRRQTDS